VQRWRVPESPRIPDFPCGLYLSSHLYYLVPSRILRESQKFPLFLLPIFFIGSLPEFWGKVQNSLLSYSDLFVQRWRVPESPRIPGSVAPLPHSSPLGAGQEQGRHLRCRQLWVQGEFLIIVTGFGSGSALYPNSLSCLMCSGSRSRFTNRLEFEKSHKNI